MCHPSIAARSERLATFWYQRCRGLGFARCCPVASQIETGMVFVNHPTWTAPDLPFGGVKNSGYGRELSSLGITEFVNRKLI
jgi:acyl-CoA reductase-like NAD-dependent aldehyde dehydrogenase